MKTIWQSRADSFEASFLPQPQKDRWLSAIDQYMQRQNLDLS
jgi:hypothetical protein